MVDFSAVTIPAIVGICAIVGFCIKHVSNNDKVHDFIPTVVCVLGTALAIANAVSLGDAVTIDVIFAGMASGLASTGLHQMVKRWAGQVDWQDADGE